MAISEARRRANDKYIREKYERLPISYPKEFCESVRESAKKNGESLAAYIRKAIEARQQAEAAAACAQKELSAALANVRKEVEAALADAQKELANDQNEDA